MTMDCQVSSPSADIVNSRRYRTRGVDLHRDTRRMCAIRDWEFARDRAIAKLKRLDHEVPGDDVAPPRSARSDVRRWPAGEPGRRYPPPRAERFAHGRRTHRREDPRA